jgi:ribosomal protein L7/L12
VERERYFDNNDEILRRWNNNGKLDAVKFAKAVLDISLKPSKDYVESLNPQGPWNRDTALQGDIWF